MASRLVRLLLTLDAMITRLATATPAALLVVTCSATPTHAQALDPASADALATTLRMLADPTRNSNGDPRAMSEALDRARSDPAGFAAMLRPETLERLRALSVKISDA